MSWTNEKQQKAYAALLDLGTAEAVDVILNWHGMQLIDEDFYNELVDQGIIEDDDDDDDDEEIERNNEDAITDTECLKPGEKDGE